MSLQLATAADTFLVVGTWTAADRTIVLTAMDNDAGTIAAADVAADANNRVNGLAVFRKTSVAV